MPTLSDAIEDVKRLEYPETEPKIPFEIGRYKNYMSHLINVCAENSPIAAQILTDAMNYGYRLSMEPLRNMAGVAHPEKKLIVLNTQCDEAMLISTLIHECRHAQQNARFAAGEKIGQCDIQSEIMIERAVEADANTASIAACHEIGLNSKNYAPFNSYIKSDPDIYYAYKRACPDMSKGPTDKAMQEAFLAWYKNDTVVTLYEECYLQNAMNYAMHKKDYQTDPYNQHLTSEQLVTAFCTNEKGECYWKDDKDILSDRNLTAIHSSSFSVIKKFFEKREKDTGIPPEESYLDLKICDKSERLFGELGHVFTKDYIKNFGRDRKDPVGLKKEATSSEKRRMNHLINELCSNKENEKILQTLKKADYTLCFEAMNKGASAVDHRHKQIILNRNADDKTLQTALIDNSKTVQVYQTNLMMQSKGQNR
ncbi:MAG: hypothetical protein MJ250_04410 [Alphaproteobacteria bacterium]|nr:hypothetical protein [Alphaproteobacteria bacterium]